MLPQDSSTPWSTPGFQIPPEASAVHHITTAMVAGKAPSLARIRPALEALADPAIPFAAHNAGFDSAFLKPAVPAWTSPWICTLRIARHLWPDAPSHGNQALRYRLALNVPGNHPPHRAMGDAIATAALLVRQVQTAGSVQRLLELSRQPALPAPRPLRQVPRPALERSAARLPRLGRPAGLGRSRSRAHHPVRPGGPIPAASGSRHAFMKTLCDVALVSAIAGFRAGDRVASPPGAPRDDGAGSKPAARLQRSCRHRHRRPPARAPPFAAACRRAAHCQPLKRRTIPA